MDVKVHFGFSKQLAPRIMNFLLKHSLPYDGSGLEEFVGVDIYTSNPCWSELEPLLHQHNLVLDYEKQFTEEELQAAEWMIIRSSWHYGWAEPEIHSNNNPTFSRNNYCSSCRSGLIQVAPFRTKKRPNWKKRHFFSFTNVWDELFVSDHAKEILLKENITGIDFCEVLSKNGKQLLEGVSQLAVKHSILPAFVETENIVKAHHICSLCGRKRFLLDSALKESYQKNRFDNAPDVIKTQDLFGAELGVPKTLIRQKVYRTIVENQLSQGLCFYPVSLI